MACQCRGWEKGKSRGAGATGKGRSRARPSLARTGGLTSDASLADPSSSEIRLTLILAVIAGARRLLPGRTGAFSLMIPRKPRLNFTTSAQPAPDIAPRESRDPRWSSRARRSMTNPPNSRPRRDGSFEGRPATSPCVPTTAFGIQKPGRKSAKHVREKIFCSILHSRFRPRFSPSKSPERTWKRDQIVLERTRCQNTRALRGLFSLIRLAILPVFAAID